jgi:hypothetical protein
VRVNHPLHSHHLVRLAVFATVAILAFAVIASVGAERAGAGSYVAVECHPELGAGHADAGYRETSSDFTATAGCAKGAGGITVGHRASETLANRFGRWTFAAPPGTHILSASAQAGGRSAGGLVPELLMRTAGMLHGLDVPVGLPRRVTWEGHGGALVARLVCLRKPRCGPAQDARLRVQRVRLLLNDTTAPSVSFGGSLTGEEVVRDVRRIEAAAGDVGGGIQKVSVQVNGHPAGVAAPPCSLSRRVALRTTPCPASTLARIRANTTARPYRQGVNSVRVCAQDYAAHGRANVRCVHRRIRVDNLCPISPVTAGVHLSAHVAGVEHGSTARNGEHPRVVGRLVGSSGEPVQGARVCVAATAEVPGARERVLAKPTTDRAGRFSVRVRPAPAMRLRIAYWPGAQGALERFDSVRFRARPRLSIRPQGTLHTGDRARFVVGLPAPYEAGRLVRVEARSSGQWIPVTGGRTGAGGVFRGSYRFHATTGRRVYRFRAVVPRQDGYPYGAGVSAVRRVVVRG